MYYINSTKTETGYNPPQTVGVEGMLQLPDSLLNTFLEYNGVVKLTIEGDLVVNVEPDLEAWEVWKETQPEPTKQEPTAEELLNALLGVTSYE